MFVRARIVCLLHCLLALLFVVPLACAAVAERSLPDPANMGTAAPCPSVSGGTGGYGSVAAGSGAAPSIEDVWMKHGGARLYYSAQYSARQQYMGGATRIDPACSPLLPPMKAWAAPATKKVTRVSKARKAKPAANPCPEVDKNTPAAAAPKAAPVADSAKTPQAENAAAAAAKSTAEAKANAADATANTTRSTAAQGTPVPATPLKVTPPTGDAVRAAAAEKPPLQ